MDALLMLAEAVLFQSGDSNDWNPMDSLVTDFKLPSSRWDWMYKKMARLYSEDWVSSLQVENIIKLPWSFHNSLTFTFKVKRILSFLSVQLPKQSGSWNLRIQFLRIFMIKMFTKNLSISTVVLRWADLVIVLTWTSSCMVRHMDESPFSFSEAVAFEKLRIQCEPKYNDRMYVCMS